MRKDGKNPLKKHWIDLHDHKAIFGQNTPNCGCPHGTTPIAYYHTHPVYKKGGFHFEYNNFDDEDKNVAIDHDLDAGYLGSLDGSFFKFDCKQNRVFPLPGRLKNTR